MFGLFVLFTNCNALVNSDAAAAAVGCRLTFERAAQHAALLLATYGEAISDGSQHRGVMDGILGIDSTSSASVLDDAAAAEAVTVTVPQRASAVDAALSLPHTTVKQINDGIRHTGVIGLAAGLYEDRRSTIE